MNKHMPSMGWRDGTRHLFSLRVYYEDTDSGGIVYYGSYMRFIERARSEWLRLAGGDALMGDGLFVVRRCYGDYHRPARLHDILIVETQLCHLKKCSLRLHQRVMKGEELVSSFDVTLAFIHKERMRVMAMPASLVACLNPMLAES